MNRSSTIYLFVDRVNNKFPGFSKIIENIKKYIPNTNLIHELDRIHPDEIILPMGIAGAWKLIKKKLPTRLAFIIDSPTLAMIGAIKFYFSQGEYLSRRVLIYALKYIKYSYLEFVVIRKYKYIIVVSEHDKNYLSRKYRSDKIRVISNGVDLPNNHFDKIVNFSNSIGVLSFWGAGGIDDIDWFVKSYLPKLRHDFPNLKFVTAGRGATNETIRYFDKHNIVYLGELDDLGQFFNTIDIMISTKRQECGILNRILDAFAYQKIVLGYGSNLLAFSNLKNGYFAFSSYEDFRYHFEYIKSHKDEIALMTRNAYNYVKQNHSWRKNYEGLQQLIKEAAN